MKSIRLEPEVNKYVASLHKRKSFVSLSLRMRKRLALMHVSYYFGDDDNNELLFIHTRFYSGHLPCPLAENFVDLYLKRYGAC